MNISSASFDRSAADLDSCPDESLPEFAFIGRSNVGKSSLLNLLAGKRDLARVSPTPGHTKLLNFFTINKTWRLVDLPGYGYAHLARKASSQFNRAVASYLQRRESLRCVFTLIDAALPPQKIDLEFVEWLINNEVPFVLVFTKLDTVTATKARQNMDAFKAGISEWCETLPEIFTCSAKAKQGRGALLGMIAEAIAAERALDDTAPAKLSSGVTVPVEELPVIGRGMTIHATHGGRSGSKRPW